MSFKFVNNCKTKFRHCLTKSSNRNLKQDIVENSLYNVSSQDSSVQ
jgi:hypothetical protein